MIPFPIPLKDAVRGAIAEHRQPLRRVTPRVDHPFDLVLEPLEKIGGRAVRIACDEGVIGRVLERTRRAPVDPFYLRPAPGLCAG